MPDDTTIPRIISPTLADLLNLVTAQHNQQPRYMATVALSVGPYADGYDVALSLLGLFDVDTSVGEQLDFVGQWVGLSRWVLIDLGVWFEFDNRDNGWNTGKWWNPYESQSEMVALDDEHYRLLLKARIGANYWDGTVAGAYAVWDYFLAGTPWTFIIQDGLPRATPYFSLDDPTGGFDRSVWYPGAELQNIYFSFDDAALGWEAGYWYGPNWALLTPLPHTHGNMNIIEALLGPPLDPILKALFTGGYLGMKSAGVGVTYVIQNEGDGADSGIGLPLFAFDSGPMHADDVIGYWATWEVEGLGFDQGYLFYPGAHPTDPNLVDWLELDSDTYGWDFGFWTPAVRPEYFAWDIGGEAHGWDSGTQWFTMGWRPAPPDPDQALPPTGVTFPPYALAGWDFGAWAKIMVPAIQCAGHMISPPPPLVGIAR